MDGFTNDLDEISSFSGYEKTEIEKVLLRMQKFDPNGVFARNLKGMSHDSIIE